MTSQLNVDTIVDKAGSGGTNVKMGNTSTYVSDGGSATQNTVQGLAKAWARLDTNDTVEDSFNIASIADNGTGDFTTTFTNAFNNNTYLLTSEGQYGSGTNDASSTGWSNGQVSITTTTFNGFFIASINNGTTFTNYDANELFLVYHGDLA